MNPSTSSPAARDFEFAGTPGSFFVTYIVVVLLFYVPLVGYSIGFNMQMEWIINNLRYKGQALQYKATFGETFKFTFIGFLLIIITAGIYIFWYVPKLYRYITAHTTVLPAGVTPASSSVTASAPNPVAQPVNPTLQPTSTPPQPPAQVQ